MSQHFYDALSSQPCRTAGVANLPPPDALDDLGELAKLILDRGPNNAWLLDQELSSVRDAVKAVRDRVVATRDNFVYAHRCLADAESEAL